MFADVEAYIPLIRRGTASANDRKDNEMKRFTTIATAAALIAASTQFALAARPAPEITRTSPEVVEVPAAQVKSNKERHQLGLERHAPVEVTKIPAGPADTSKGRG